ncbi:hypothetical protein [Pseudarthrobacter sp. NPDC058119]|uniref:hypothetical protein n=1 Tax=Pseudarthrobacter sp. NPDC058119 TaxID=3346348 RepID=UPI0036D94CD2
MTKFIIRRFMDGLGSLHKLVAKCWTWFTNLSFWPKLAAVLASLVAITVAITGVIVASSTIKANESTIQKNEADTKKAAAEAAQAASASASASLAALPSEKAKNIDGSSPDALCKNDFLEWATFNFVQPNSEKPATTMRVLGSELCTSAWVHVFNTLEGTRVEKTIERIDAPDLKGHQESTPNDISTNLTNELNKNSFSMQVFAPGCVWVSFVLTRVDSGEVLWEVPRQQVCKP